MGRIAEVIHLKTRRPVPHLSDFVSIRAIAGGGIEFVIAVPGAEPVELHPSEAEVRALVNDALDAIDFAKELAR